MENPRILSQFSMILADFLYDPFLQAPFQPSPKAQTWPRGLNVWGRTLSHCMSLPMGAKRPNVDKVMFRIPPLGCSSTSLDKFGQTATGLSQVCPILLGWLAKEIKLCQGRGWSTNAFIIECQHLFLDLGI